MIYDRAMTGDERIRRVFDAIDAERRELYGAQVPMHYGTMIPWLDGGDCSAIASCVPSRR